MVEKVCNNVEDYDCKVHLDITNFTISEIEARSAISMKRIVLNDSEGYRRSYIAALYDQEIENV